MFQELICVVSWIYTALIRLSMVAVLIAATMAMWHFYQQELLQAQLRKAGVPITVRGERTDRKARDIWDEFFWFLFIVVIRPTAAQPVTAW